MTKKTCFFLWLIYYIHCIFLVVNVGKSTAHLSQEYH